MFLGRSDGRLTALDSATGELLWEFQTDGGVHASPTIFEHEGEQHLAAYAGGTIFAGSKRGDGVWLFSLSGTIESLPPGAADPGAPPPIPGAIVAAAAVSPPADREPDLAHGRELYVTACLPCHGAGGEGGHDGGGAPLTDALTVETILTTTTNGRDAMPAFGPIYSREDLHDVAGYILEELAGD